MNRPRVLASLAASAAGILVLSGLLLRSASARPPVASPAHAPTPALPARHEPTPALPPPAPATDLTDQVLAASLRWATETDPARRETLLAGLAALVSDANAAEFLRSLPPGLLDSPAADDALARWSAQDPAGALAWLAGLAHPPPHQLATTLRAWMERDAEALRQELASLPPGDWQQQLLGLAGRLALQQNRPADAAVWLHRIAPENRTPAELHWALQAWGRADLPSALEWAAALPASATQETLFSAALIGHAATNPRQALDLALGLLDASEARNRALSDLMGEWARLDPTEAAAALPRFPSGPCRDLALAALLGAWRDYDPAGVRAWVGRQAAGPGRDLAACRLAALESRPCLHSEK